MIASLSLIAAFLALWLVPARWALAGGGAERPLRGTSAVFAVYAALFLAAAWWWQVPLGVQRAVNAAAASPAQAEAPKLTCSEAAALGPVLKRMSGGRLALTDAGDLLADPEMWAGMSQAQRDLLRSTAEQARRCAGGGSGPLRVLDGKSGQTLD